MYYVYILYSSSLDKKYIGFTQNLKKRIPEHNAKKVPFTAKGTPWQLIYYEVFRSKQDAMEEEKFLKSGKGRERLSFLLSQTLQDIYTDR
ncbi:MAG: GIY-YIG nuclease superfamily protein [Candidatus Magasanikbacteria bacterium CG11_big_fil_rev_8_21_14_0_20_43_7]|uniref:GIY-YIG nuclease superfamily protein n=1 Tax=Candidatus Magasanikbacteria bacterium CG11_big_fil_rev_8_21_14_0_20_43_7 TaxID=1974654 RepID=A0A2H0N3C5_9BACT|nr:MAG: GIY-YIG nuclease superfamily protein [Candidatus Magasanikbacteria bacterium CG11_big_fil_rev_8_21_14_0_20_43_7]